MALRRFFSYSSQFRPASPRNLNLNVGDSSLSHLAEHRKSEEHIEVLCQQKRLKEAVDFLHRIHQPSPRIYSILIVACVRHRSLELGKRVHAHTKASNFIPGIVISNRLLHMYSKCGSLIDAQMVFDEMPQKDLCSWNTMISGYANIGRLEQARKLFDEMPQRDNFSWNAVISGYVSRDRHREALDLFRIMQVNESSNSNMFTLSSALAATTAIQSLRIGKEIHGYLIRTEMNLDEVVWTALLDLYDALKMEERKRDFTCLEI